MLQGLQHQVLVGQIRVGRQAPEAESNWGHGMVSHVAWMGSTTRYQIRLDAGQTIEASVPSLDWSQSDAPGVDEEVYVTWSHDAGTVLAS